MGRLYDDLIDTMYAKDGLGLAAVQIGEPWSVFVLNVPYVEELEPGRLPDPPPDGIRGRPKLASRYLIKTAPAGVKANYQPILFINPVFITKSEERNVDQEGCLSFPGVFASVERHTKVVIKSENRFGVTVLTEAEGLYARAIQHEHDHLSGVLLVDLVGPVKRELIKSKMRKRAKQ